MTSIAEFNAWIMFMRAMSAPLRAQLFTLAHEMLGHLLEYILEHEVGIEPRALVQGAVPGRLAPCGRYLLVEFLRERRVALLRPLTQRDEMLLEALDRIAERPALIFVLRTVARRIVAGRMGRGTIGHMFDQRGT